jgi:hypothetical protein
MDLEATVVEGDTEFGCLRGTTAVNRQRTYWFPKVREIFGKLKGTITFSGTTLLHGLPLIVVIHTIFLIL